MSEEKQSHPIEIEGPKGKEVTIMAETGEEGGGIFWLLMVTTVREVLTTRKEKKRKEKKMKESEGELLRMQIEGMI